MLKKIHELIDKADAVIHYNGTKFDIPTLNKEFLIYGLSPPAPFKQIDLLKVAKSQFRFPSNKLDYVAQTLGVGKKHTNIGHELWIKCMNHDPVAWAQMEVYNIQDVYLLEKVYDKLKPWIKHHANYSLYSDNHYVCPNCGSDSYQKRGFAYTLNNKYQRFQCKNCGNWFRDTKALDPKAGKKFTNIN